MRKYIICICRDKVKDNKKIYFLKIKKHKKKGKKIKKIQ